MVTAGAAAGAGAAEVGRLNKKSKMPAAALPSGTGRADATAAKARTAAW